MKTKARKQKNINVQFEVFHSLSLSLTFVSTIVDKKKTELTIKRIHYKKKNRIYKTKKKNYIKATYNFILLIYNN